MHLVEKIKAKARASLQTVVLPEGYDDRMVQAAGRIVKEGLAKVVLLGNPDTLKKKAAELGASLDGVELLEPKDSPRLGAYVDELVALRKSKGLTAEEAKKLLTGADNLYYGAMMVRLGDAGGAVAGADNTTGDVLRAAFPIQAAFSTVSSPPAGSSLPSTACGGKLTAWSSISATRWRVGTTTGKPSVLPAAAKASAAACSFLARSACDSCPAISGILPACGRPCRTPAPRRGPPLPPAQ